MQSQKREFWCGPAAISNALSCYGKRASQARIARLAGTTEEGTDEHEMINAIDSLGYVPSELETSDRSEALRWLTSLSLLVPLILAVSRWNHWVVVAGRCGEKSIVVDSESSQTMLVTHVRDKRLMARWRAARAQRTEGGLYYGLAILKGPKVSKP